MDQSFVIVIVVLFFALVVALAIYGRYAAAQRRKEMAAWAASRGLSYSSDNRPELAARYPVFRALAEGDNQYGYNLCSGDWGGRPVLAFDYHYETHSTDSKGNRQTTNHCFSAVILQSRLPLEPLVIRPEGLFDKVKAFFGVEGIKFESAEFSRKFFVSAPNRKWAYDVIHPRTMELLLGSPQFHIEFDTTCAIAYHGQTFKPEEFDSAANLVAGILNGLPEYVVEQQLQG